MTKNQQGNVLTKRLASVLAIHMLATGIIQRPTQRPGSTSVGWKIGSKSLVERINNSRTMSRRSLSSQHQRSVRCIYLCLVLFASTNDGFFFNSGALLGVEASEQPPRRLRPAAAFIAPSTQATAAAATTTSQSSSTIASDALTLNTGFSPGSIYHTERCIPVLGRQIFRLTITGSNTARLLIRGVLNVDDDNIQYKVDETSGEIRFELSDQTRRILKRFRTSLGRVGYDAVRDVATLEVKPPLPAKITLLFTRLSALD